MTLFCAALALGVQPNPPGDLALFCQREGIVGLSVAVIAEGKVRTYEGGWADREMRKPVTSRTLFRLGSISKPVTAVLVMRQVEKGRLNLNQGVSTWVKGFDDPSGAINLMRVLSHTSGVRHYLPGKPDTQFEPMSVNQGLGVFAKDKLLFEPGEKYSYSTHALTLAAASLETVTGRSFADLVVSLGIPTLKVEDRKAEGDRSRLYAKAETSPRLELKEEDISWKAAGGGMESTASDLAQFAEGVMKGSLVAAASRSAMWTPQTLNSGAKTSYGLGWQSMAGGKWGHGGAQQGCSTMLIIDPSQKKVVAVMANTSGAGAPVRRLAELALGW